MAQRKNKKKNKQNTPPAPVEPPPPALHPALFAIGMIAILVAAGASLMLVLHHFTDLALPGCGADSGCDVLADSIWGKVPLINWPTSFVGFAWFIGIGLAWMASIGGITNRVRWLIRIGAVVSVVLIGVMIQKQTLCSWCLGTHIANFVLLAASELGARRAGATMRPTKLGLAGFAVATLGLLITNIVVGEQITEKRAGQLDEDLEKIVQGTNCDNADWGPDGFTGRYVRGPEDAPIRIMMYSDFQCPDCKKFEEQLMPILATRRDDISVSMKHFPFCGRMADGTLCNEYLVNSGCRHANACWAALAAEAAGRLQGNGGFWRMHDWLFDRRGSFTNAELRAALPSLGFTYEEFGNMMQRPELMQVLHADIKEAKALGLFFTPLVFINGVQLRNPWVPGTLQRAIDELDAAGLVRATAVNDCPPLAMQKYIDDWMEYPYRFIRFELRPHTLGIGDEKVQVLVFGSYLNDNTRALDQRIRNIVGNQDGVHYSFVQSPQEESCNPNVQLREPLIGSCRAARIAEAAGVIGGGEAFWAMHTWLMANADESLGDQAVMAAAESIGLNGQTLLATINAGEVTARIANDVTLSRQLGPGHYYPRLYVNGRHVPRWKLPGEPIIENIIETARETGRPVNTGPRPGG